MAFALLATPSAAQSASSRSTGGARDLDGGPVSAASASETPENDSEDEGRDKGDENVGVGDGAADEIDPADGPAPVLVPVQRTSPEIGADAIIASSRVIVDRAGPDEERQLSSFLFRYIGKPATQENLAGIEQWLLELGRYRAAVCRFSGTGKARQIRCGVTRAPTIRSVSLEGLPGTLLETDVMRRVFLRPGEVLDEKDTRGRTRIARQEERLERYLERKGLYGATVRVLSPPVSRTSDVDVVIRIIGGSFAAVRKVSVVTPLPLTRGELEETFGRMCTGEGLLEGFETLRFACYTQERTRAVTERLEARLRKLGYPEARIQVAPSFVGIDPSKKKRGQKSSRVAPAASALDSAGGKRKAPAASEMMQRLRSRLKVEPTEDQTAASEDVISDECKPLPPSRKGRNETPRCVDLTVTVQAGPHLVPTIRIRGEAEVNPYTRDPFAALTPGFAGIRDFGYAVARILSSSVELPSRLVQLGAGRPLHLASGTDLNRDELMRVLTFNEARSADEVESQVSAQALRFALQRRGYFFAGVYPDYRGGEDRVDVTFEVDPGDPVAIKRVMFHGNHQYTDAELFSAVELAARKRGPTTNGFVTQLDLSNDRRRILSFYERQGFVEADVEVDAERVGRDGVVVHFRIGEGAQWHVDAIELDGIPSGLVNDVLGALEHCQGGVAAKAGRKPITSVDCAGSPFRPSDEDALSLDRQRVLNVFVSEGFPYASAEIVPVDFRPDGGVVLRISVDPLGDSSEATKLKAEKNKAKRERKRKEEARKQAANGGDDAPSDDDKSDATGEGAADGTSDEDIHADTAFGRVRLGEVFIDGARISRRDVMLRELAISQDRVLRPRRIAEGVSRLRRTGLYSRVELDFIGIEEKADRVHLRIQVEERPTVTVDTSLGFSTDRLFAWRLEARDRNFYGTMFDVSGLLDFGLFIGRHTNAQGQVRWPRVLGTSVDIRYTPSFVYEDRPSTDIPRVPGEPDAQLALGVWSVDQFRRRQARIGQVIGAQYQPIPKSDLLTLSLDLEQRLEWTDNLAKPITPFSLESLATVDGMTLAFQQCVLPVSTVTPKVTVRDLDNPFDPKNGYRLEGAVMLGHPILGSACGLDVVNGIEDLSIIGEWVGLFSASATGYVTFGRLTLAGNVRAWTGIARSDDRLFQSSLIRNQNLLALGGDRSIRGFNQDDIGLKSYSTRPEEGVDVYNGNNLLSVSGGVVNLEARTTLVPNFFIGDLNAAAFLDMGMVTDTLDLPWLAPRSFWQQLSMPQPGYDDPRLGVGVGVGLRYVLPVGPISADFAVRPDPVVDALFGLVPRDFGFDVHFQLGYVF